MSCALDETHQLWCWGRNVTGAFGNGTFSNSRVPVPGASGLSLTSVNLSSQLGGCGLATSGLAYCWGNLTYFGDGQSSRNAATPELAGGGATWLAVEAHEDGACGIRADHSVWCWGEVPAVPGYANPGVALAPIQVAGMQPAQRIDGNFWTVCSLTASDVTSAKCYGDPLDDIRYPRFDPLAELWATDFIVVGLTTDSSLEIWGVVGTGQTPVDPVYRIPGAGWRAVTATDTLLFGIYAADSGVYALNPACGLCTFPVNPIVTAVPPEVP